MPVGLPPRGGPLGRTRGRLSASALTTYLRCPRQWLLGYQVGLQGPTRPSQVLGIVLEEAFCDLLMMHPPAVASLDELLAWAHGQVSTVAIDALAKGEAAWDNVLWKSDPHAWEEVDVASIEQRLEGGLRLFMEEVKACFSAEGGPYLEAHRAGSIPFDVPAPTLGAAPVFPLPGKVRDVELRRGRHKLNPRGRPGAPSLARGMECARPGSKILECISRSASITPMVGLLVNSTWCCDGMDTSNCDIKLGTHTQRSQPRLNTNFDSMLVVARNPRWPNGPRMEGWYLEASERVAYTPPVVDEMSELTDTYKDTTRPCSP